MSQKIDFLSGSTRKTMMLHLTFECNARCAHCAYSCSPERHKLRLTPDEVRLAIATAKLNGFESLHLSGGEPYLALDLVELSLKEAWQSGLRISIETNASWAKTPTLARDVLTPWAELGLSWLLLSYDRYHAKFIKPQCLINACEQAERLGLNVEIRITETHDDTRQHNIDSLKPVQKYIADGFFYFPASIGRGADLPARELTLSTPVPLECTHFLYKQLLLAVFPGQLVSFNCEFANPRLTYRYPLKKNWLADMLDVWSGDQCVRDMWHKGLSAINKAFNVVEGQPCEFCFNLLPHLYPGRELLDIRTLS